MAIIAARNLTPLRARQRSRVRSRRPPVGGWNTRDPAVGMQPEDAVVLDNWFPGYGTVDVREGYADHATGVGSGDVETIAEYHAGANQSMLAAGGGAIYDATAAGAATSKATGFTSNQWQFDIMDSTMMLVNGADAPQTYDGSSVAAATISGSGLTVADLIDVHKFKTRMFYAEKDSQSFWYSAVNAAAGVLTEFQLGRVGHFGGNLQAIASITHDAGDGPDDFAAFIMSSGQVIVYAGTDPSDATAWSIVGVYDMGAPIGRRPTAKIGNDSVVITESDYVPLSNVFRQGELRLTESKISGAARAAARDYNANFGWIPVLHAKQNMLLINVPVTASSIYHQHVQNTTTGAWCRFTGIPAVTWGVYNRELYFGSTDGTVRKFGAGVKADDGVNITAIGQTAWDELGNQAPKQLHAIRPLLVSESGLTLNVGMGTDFAAVSAEGSVASAAPVTAPWDTAVWDVSSWSAEDQVVEDWLFMGDHGCAFSQYLRISVDQTVQWYRNDYLYEQAANI